MHTRKDDQVEVISGNYRGKRGKVLKVFPDRNRVIVEGINFIHRHTRPSTSNPKGGIVEKEAPIHASNVMVICPKCNTRTRMGSQAIKDEAKNRINRIRICKNCGEMIVKAA